MNLVKNVIPSSKFWNFLDWLVNMDYRIYMKERYDKTYRFYREQKELKDGN